MAVNNYDLIPNPDLEEMLRVLRQDVIDDPEDVLNFFGAKGEAIIRELLMARHKAGVYVAPVSKMFPEDRPVHSTTPESCVASIVLVDHRQGKRDWED